MEETEANQQLFTHNLVLPVKSIVPVIMLSLPQNLWPTTLNASKP
jgi:hypothetical protein